MGGGKKKYRDGAVGRRRRKKKRAAIVFPRQAGKEEKRERNPRPREKEEFAPLSFAQGRGARESTTTPSGGGKKKRCSNLHLGEKSPEEGRGFRLWRGFGGKGTF